MTKNRPKSCGNRKKDSISEKKNLTNDSRIQYRSKLYTNFRKTPILTTCEEIDSNLNPFLQKNKIIGKQFVDKYLTIHFNLNREEVNRSLRLGIKEYKKMIDSGKRVHKIEGIRVYEKTKIVNRCTKSLNAFWAQLDTERLGFINWTYSKSLIYGSLLCFSSNNFKTFCYASVVSDRDEENLSKGWFQLELETEFVTEEFKHIDSNTWFVMIESEVYFEAHKYTLLALKQLNDNNFPFKQYIISLNKDQQISNNLPKYMNGSTLYDLSLMITTADGTETDLYKNVRIIASTEWPNAEIMAFDDSQYEAFRTALWRRFVLIQGPPGTGKTYVGLKIVQTLHHNRNVWNNCKSEEKPIVIICYTNHALDQFLEGMLPFCHHLIRIGGRSKSELLKEYTLGSIREKMKEIDFCPKQLNYKIAKCYRNREKIHEEITEIDLEINNCSTDLLNPKYLYEYLEKYEPMLYIETQMESLLKNYSNDFDLALIKWITNCDYNESNEVHNTFELKSNQNSNIQKNLRKKSFPIEVDEQEVNYIIDNRMTDTRNWSEFNDSNVRVFNTIFKTINKKSLKQISRRVIEQLKKEMRTELKSKDVMNCEEAIKFEDISQLKYSDRWRLYRHWVEVYIDLKKGWFERLNIKFDFESKTLKELHLEKDMYLIRGNEIIGITTTGAAKFRNIIEKIDPKIIVIEEAAEILESNLITSLTKNTEHLILIGDHKQLKPRLDVYELANKYNFDLSLFERMINNGMPFNQLKLQHRMRPEISKLLVPHIYEELKDHKSVLHYEDIIGIKRNMFFINHSHMESSKDERMSISNEFETKLIIRLAKHLLFQDYEPSKITILTLYSSQLILISRELQMDSSLDGINVYNVDNFQGEENDIILVSFVRSNGNNKIGFLKTLNRVNVSLSRAKRGLYCIGNFDFLSKNSKLWNKITEYLRLKNVKAIGPKLELRCSNHPKQIICVSNVDDFNVKSPYGGCARNYSHDLKCGHLCPLNVCHVNHPDFECKQICLKQLNCEHKHNCPMICHFPDDCGLCGVLMYKKVAKCGHIIEEICSGNMFCYFNCEQTLECGHKCNKSCGEDCQTECVALMEKIVDRCGHTIVGQCSKDPVCYLRCGKLLSCGHECELKCSEICDPNKCLASIEKIFDECGHRVETECSQMVCCKEISIRLTCGHDFRILCHEKNNFINSSEYCTEKCGQLLVCGHRCEGMCIECNQSRLHIECQQKCDRNLICGHICSGICGETCPPCDQICQNRCSHRSCRHTCSQPCIRCPKSCLWKCNHKKCTKMCYEICDRDLCLKTCPKKLKCGHQCIGLCGQKCPKFCLICDNSRRNQLIGTEGMSDSQIINSKYIELENCKHIIELKALNTLLLTENFENGNQIFKRCPNCKKNILFCQSFDDLIQKQFLKLIEMNRKLFCYNEHNRPEQKRLNDIIYELSLRKTFNKSVEHIIEKLLKDLKKETELTRSLYIRSKSQLSIIENKLIVISSLLNVLTEMGLNEQLIRLNGPEFRQTFQSKLILQYFERMNKFLDFISSNFVNSLQQISDSERELRFFILFSKLLNHFINYSVKNEKLVKFINALDMILNTGAFTIDMENAFQSNIIVIIGENFKFEKIKTKLIPNNLTNPFQI